MPWAETLRPARMSRIAVVVPRSRLRSALVALSEDGSVELEGSHAAHRDRGEIRGLLESSGHADAEPALSATPTDAETLVAEGRWELLAGEAQLEDRAAAALEHGRGAVLAGWTPTERLGSLSARLAEVGAAAVELPHPAAVDAPTLIRGSRVARSARPLVDTFATVPYRDVDPALFAGASFALMFGMMFGDVGGGLLLVALGLYLARAKRRPFVGFRRTWALVTAAGVAAIAFGFLYGEFFGPTGVVPVIWMSPLDDPVRLLVAGIAVGGVLIGISFVLGTINRWREGGPGTAIYAASGLAGAAVYFGGAAAVGGAYWDIPALLWGGVAVLAVGLVLTFVGFSARAGAGASGSAQASVELFDSVLRIGTNTVSFARLAAFGLMHAALAAIVWEGAQALAHGTWMIAAAALFVVGNLAAFALEVLVVGIQAIRLEYYELFSRILTSEGRVFEPWHVPLHRPNDRPNGVNA
ncbi:MAG TPA: V-type ATPase 116kDa subunit family protein [Actinomycetota bacterium]